MHLDKADTSEVRVSSVLDAGDLASLGLWNWILSTNPSSTILTQLTNPATTGQHWMLTPYRMMTLVHAVRQPLLAPTVQSFSTARTFGDTFTRLNGLLDVQLQEHGADGRARLVARAGRRRAGRAVAELPRQPRVARRRRRAPAAHAGSKPDQLAINDVHHEFHDTKRRNITYVARATSAFTEYFQAPR